MQLRLAHTVPSTEAEGPGRRFALWVKGCSLRCPGCCNPELFEPDRGGTLVDPAALARDIVSTAGIEGVSVLGGEPFEQAGALAAVCAPVRAAGLSVMVYSGYTLAELHGRALTEPGVRALLDCCDLLLDGRYDAALPERRRRWIGSSNQVLHFLSDRYSPDDARFSTPNTVEVRFAKGQVLVNGWPALADALRKGP